MLSSNASSLSFNITQLVFMPPPKTTSFSPGNHDLSKIQSTRLWLPNEEEFVVGWPTIYQVSHTNSLNTNFWLEHLASFKEHLASFKEHLASFSEHLASFREHLVFSSPGVEVQGGDIAMAGKRQVPYFDTQRCHLGPGLDGLTFVVQVGGQPRDQRLHLCPASQWFIS
jgi:hypothetical protein